MSHRSQSLPDTPTTTAAPTAETETRLTKVDIGIAISDANKAKAGRLGVEPYIHDKDFIFRFVARNWRDDIQRAVDRYYDLGQYSSKLAADLVAEVSRGKASINEKWQPKNLLDFASGYGCTSRHLQKAFPDLRIATCDIHEEAINFNSEVLGLESYISASAPEALSLPLQDVILAMSFFTHMPNATFTRWLQSLAAHLNPGGLLIFTANGFITDAKGTTGVKVGENGFGFEPRSEQIDLDGYQYGITISYPRWVFRALEQTPELRLVRFQEGNWWAIQDTYVCVHR